MAESSKILTVSYGTFSCTLEGFEDSFGTMKAIAEYFRDLAAGDRYFGAEPPTPDAEMLAHIAARESARRVEARTDESGIVLRAAAALAPAAPDPGPRTEAVAALSDTTTPGDEVAASDPPAVVAVDRTETLSDRDVAPLPDLDKLADAVASEANAAAHPMPPQPARPQDAPAPAALAAAEAEAEIHETPAPAAATEEADVTPDAPEKETPPLLVVSDPVAQAAAFENDVAFDGEAGGFAQMQTSALAAALPTSTAPALADSDSVAAKLQRIRAVVGRSEDDDTASGANDEFAEDLNEPEPAVTDMLPDTSSIEAALAAANVPEEDEPDSDEDIDTDLDNAINGHAWANAFDAEDDSDEDEEPVDFALLSDEDDEDEAETMDTPADDAADNASDDSTDAEPARPALRARILRVGRLKAAEGDENDAAQPGAAALDGADDLAGFESDVEGTLDPDAEAELQRDLAEAVETGDDSEVLADAAAEDMAEADPVEAAAELETALAAEARRDRPGRAALPVNDDAAMARIMDQADEELSDPEGNRRRNAIAQLKAAVAATEAARQLGDAEDRDAGGESAFRNDLEQVVRPRRAARPDTGAPRSERPRPAPLKLVASQRVDLTPADPSADPVRPRRVATSQPVTPSDASNFAEFAQEMGAKDLPDLLEAAAAYTAFVEGIEDFSRPQIMKKVQLTATEEFTREDGLRSFGTLLRQGRISKVSNGRFQISDQTRFKPEARAAQG